MSMEIQKLVEERAKLVGVIKSMADKINEEKRDFTPEEKQNWEKVNKDHDSILAREQALIRAAQLGKGADNAGQQRPGDDFSGNNQKTKRGRDERAEFVRGATEKFLRGQLNGDSLTAEDIAELRKEGLPTNGRVLDLQWSERGLVRGGYDRITRAAQTVTTSGGGYLIPTDLVSQLEVSMLSYNPLRGIADTFRTEGGNPINWPTMSDHSNVGSILAINTQISDTALAFGQITFGAYKYTSTSVLVPTELFEDSAFDIASIVGTALGERLGRIQATHFTTGDNSSKPQGIVTASSAGKTAASATAITHDEIIDLMHSVNPAYRTGPSVGFMMHDSIIAYVRKLKDSQGQYLWQPSLQAGLPGTIHGYPVYVNQAMDSAVTAAKVVALFGDFSKYKIRDAGGVRLVRMNERYADYDQVGFVAFIRTDARMLDAGTDPVKHLITAAS